MRLARCINTRTRLPLPPTRRASGSEHFARGAKPVQTRAGKRVKRPARESPPSGAGARQRVAGGGTRGLPSEAAQRSPKPQGRRGRRPRTKATKERSGGGVRGARRKAKRTLRRAKRDGATRATGGAGGARHDARERARHGASNETTAVGEERRRHVRGAQTRRCWQHFVRRERIPF